VVLLRNERDEWELPGGKLEPGEDPATCVVREIKEEVGLSVAVDAILDSWVYNICGQVEVLIVTYRCRNLGPEDISVSHEHKEVALFYLEQLDSLPMPNGYRVSIKRSRSEDRP